MTLLIAAKAGPNLRPKGTKFTFEPGIVMAADTRLSYANGNHIDNGLKIGPTGLHAICGMASDSIDIPSQAFHYFDRFMTNNPNILAHDAVVKLKQLLLTANDDVSTKLGRDDLNTTVFFGHHETASGRFRLFRLNSNNNFTAKIKESFNAAGSHADWVQESFDKIKEQYATCKLKPFDGFPNNKVTIREGVAPLVMCLAHAALEVARTEEALGRNQAIGGSVSATILTADGAKSANPRWDESLQTWQIFEGKLG